MSDTIRPIVMNQGDSLTRVITIYTDTAKTVPLNLTGYLVRAQVRRSYGATTVLINCTLANGKVALTNAAGGVISLILVPDDTASIRFNSVEDAETELVYDIEVESPGGQIFKAAKGTFTLMREVTR